MGNRGNMNGLDCDALDRHSRNALKWRRGVVKRAKRAFSRRMRRLNKLGVDNDDVSEMALISAAASASEAPAWRDPNDAPEVTDDMLDRATIVKDGKVIQRGRPPLGDDAK